MKGKVMKGLKCALAVSVLFSSMPAMAAPVEGSTQGVIAEVENGKILGYNEDGINIFKGIPYAHAERFEMPEDAEDWDGIRNCLVYSSVCPQQQIYQGINQNEYLSLTNGYYCDFTEDDFLTVNVWTKDMNPETPKPVIFWIHGGGYANGSSGELKLYDGKNLTDYGDVVFVSVNHRLNYLGYMDVSAYGDEYKYSGNVGHADLVKALEWVQENIATFGGDPNNVTIEGQSGGSTKVCQLMAMPSAKGLFHKVVAQSSGSYDFTRNTKEDAVASTAKLVEELGLADKSNEEIMDYLKNMDYEDLANAASAAGVKAGVEYDGEFVMENISYSKDIPLMVGSVFGEFSGNASFLTAHAYMEDGIVSEEQYSASLRDNYTEEDIKAAYEAKYGDKAEAVMEAFQKAYPDHDLFDGLYIQNRSNNVAYSFAEAGGKAYEYVASYIMPMFGGVTPWHTGGCIGWFFRNTDVMHTWIAGDEEAAETVSKTMANALVNFAYTGNPSQEGLEWPAFTCENGETMVFDRDSEVRNYHDQEFMELIAQK